jgi:hypothetical protein
LSSYFLAPIFFALIVASTLYAQSGVATLKGLVRDPTGGVVPDATVTLKNTETNVVRHGASNSVGDYAFFDLPPGTYVLEASKSGFAVSRSDPFALAVNQGATLDILLTIGSVAQTVSVEATATQVESSTSELGSVISTRQMTDLPLNGRNFTQLLSLTAGVSPISVGSNANGYTAQPLGEYDFGSVNGQENRSNYWMLDGSFNMSGWGQSTYAVAPILDTIQEFKIQSHNDDAEFGGVTGGIVNVVTKSGTNTLHGNAWEFVRNNDLDGRNFFASGIVPYRWNMFGVNAGGPVVLPKLYNGKNKTFFMLGYQGLRNNQTGQSYYRVPTAANLTGDLSDLPLQVYNPFSTVVNSTSSSGYNRSPFMCDGSGNALPAPGGVQAPGTPCNKIPTSMMDPTMLAFLKWLPGPNTSGVADRNLLLSTPSVNDENDYTARIDENIGTKDFLWFRYSGTLESEVGSAGLLTTSTVALDARNVGVTWVRTISPTSVFEAQFGRVHVKLNDTQEYNSIPSSVSQGFPSSWINGYHSSINTPKVPQMGVTSWFSGGTWEQLQPSLQSTWLGKAVYTKVRGHHTFKMGGEIDSSTFLGYVLNSNLSFSSFNTADPNNPGTTGHSLATMMLDVPDSAARRDSLEPENFGGVLGMFFHDQWRVTPRLTVNLGIRYDYTIIPNFGSKSNGTAYSGNLDYNTGIYTLQEEPPSCAVTNAAPCIPGGALPAHVAVSPNGKIFDNWSDNVGPRVGVAYRLSTKTAIRGGFGVFYDNWASFNQSAQNFEGTWPSVAEEQMTNVNRPSPQQVTPNVVGTNPPFVMGLPSPTPFQQYTWFINPHMKDGYSEQWNFGVERQVSPSTTLSVNYVGSANRRLDLGEVYNGASTPGPGDWTQRVPVPWAGESFWDNSIGRSDYNGLQVSMQRHFSKGITYLMSYTWSKSMDFGCSGWYAFEGCSIQNPYNWEKDKSVSGFDVPNLFSFAFVYESPFGQGRSFSTNNRAANYLLGNWQLNGVLSLRNGTPYSLSVPGDIANIGYAGERPNQVGNPYPATQTPREWLVPSAFAPPATYTFGNVGRNSFRSDWGRNLDFSVFRDFPIRESMKLQFRAEAFNLTNTPIFGAPASTVTASDFGQVESAGSPRLVQLALKLIF